MKVEVIQKEKNQAKIAVTVPASDMEKHFDKAIKLINEKEKFEGFRPGHAPRKIIENKIGMEKINSEVIKVALDATYISALEQVKIMPIAQPKIQITKLAPKNPFSYTIEVDTFPEVELGDYKNIKIKKPEEPKEASKKEVDDVLGKIQKQLAEYKDKKGKIEKGDKVEIDFTGSLKNVPLEDASSKNHPLIIGEGSFIEGFEEKLIGLKPEDKTEFEITFPKDYRANHLAGQKVKFKVEIKKVWSVKLPAIDNEFAKKINPKFDLKKLKKDVQENILKQKKSESEMKFKSAIIDQVVEKSKIEISQSLIEEESETMIKETSMKLAQQGSSFEKYLESIKKTKEELKKEWAKEAEKRVKTGLVIAEIAKQEKITVTPKKIQAEIDQQLIPFAGAPKEQVKKMREQFESDRQKKQIELNLRNRKTIDKLVEIAQS